MLSLNIVRDKSGIRPVSTVIVDRVGWRMWAYLMSGRRLSGTRRLLVMPCASAWTSWRGPSTGGATGRSWTERAALAMLRRRYPDVTVERLGARDYRSVLTEAGVLAASLADTLVDQCDHTGTRYMAMYKGLLGGSDDVLIAIKKLICADLEDLICSLLLAAKFDPRDSVVLIDSARNASLIETLIDQGGIRKQADGQDCRFQGSPANRQAQAAGAAAVNTLLLWGMILRTLVTRCRFTAPANIIRAKVACRNLYKTERRRPGDTHCLNWGDMAFLLDETHFTVDDFVVLASNRPPDTKIRHADSYRQSDLRVYDIRKARLPLNRAAKRLASQGITGMRLICSDHPGAVARIACGYLPFFLAEYNKWLAICANVRFTAYLDINEHSYAHIIQKMALSECGAHIVYLPHGYMERIGPQKSFMSYALMLSPGEHLVRAFGQYWPGDMAVEIVGNMKNEAVGAGEGELADQGLQKLFTEARRDGGRVITAVFGSCLEDELLMDRYERMLDFLAEVMEENPGVQAFVKFKTPRQTEKFRRKRMFDLLEGLLKGGRVHLVDGDRYQATVQAMAVQSDAVISVSGYNQSVSTAWVESMLLGKPSLAFNPEASCGETPLLDDYYDQYIFRSEAKLKAALDRVLNGHAGDGSVSPMAKRDFDPFCDGGTMNRIRRALYAFAENPGQYSCGIPSVGAIRAAAGDKYCRQEGICAS
ncbi:MAG: hypothetical protein KC900_12105 [Candidatus Omnitrophica bacterium]|nr:hypothetical protein [Candidatus Omnitrophota bacterium]